MLQGPAHVQGVEQGASVSRFGDNVKPESEEVF